MVRYSQTKLIERFKQFLRVDLQLREKTVTDHITSIYRLMEFCDPLEASREDLRSFLEQFVCRPKTYAWHLCALKRLYRDFLNRPDLVSTFKFPTAVPRPRLLPSKGELREFASYLDQRDLALFLVLASSGLRRSEVLSLRLENVDLNQRVFLPARTSQTKFAWLGFFNEEAEEALRSFIASRKAKSQALFPYAREKLGVIWKDARTKTGLHITPQTLRFWFANEMARLGVPDRFIDAFQGRIPRSVLARHYTDYSLENLKQIYDKAGLKVLS